jgi:sugar-specific transcriptional regulator TrmB
MSSLAKNITPLEKDDLISLPTNHRKIPSAGGEEPILARDLVRLGLKGSDASLYLYLLSRGTPTPVHSISKDTGLHRVDLYRRLKDLEQNGLVEMHLETPKKYSAVEPQIAISSLVHKMEAEISSIRKSTSSLESRLELFKKSASKEPLVDESERGAYRLVLGRARQIQEIRGLIRSAKLEVLRILSPNTLPRIFMYKLDKDYINAKRRGVPVRMIADINSETLPYAKRVSKILQLRHLDGVNFRATIVDRATVTFSTRFDESDMSINAPGDEYLMSNDKRFAEATCFIFEHLWKNATPVEKLPSFQKK